MIAHWAGIVFWSLTLHEAAWPVLIAAWLIEAARMVNVGKLRRDLRAAHEQLGWLRRVGGSER